MCQGGAQGDVDHITIEGPRATSICSLPQHHILPHHSVGELRVFEIRMSGADFLDHGTGKVDELGHAGDSLAKKPTLLMMK